MHQHRIEAVDFILADLGVSSAQFADIDTGLSFQVNMPLDMRIDKRLKTTAADIINRFDEKSLADLIYQFSQDRASRRIALSVARPCSSRETTSGRSGGAGPLMTIVSSWA